MSRMASGLKAWFVQRLTGIYIAGFILYLLWFFTTQPIDHASLSNWVGSELHAISLLFFAFALLYHAWIGVRDIAIDYVRPDSLRVVIMTLIGVGLIGLAIWAVLIVLARQI